MLIEPKTVPIILKLCQHNWEEPTGGAGFFMGAAAGAGVGAFLNACMDEEKDARSARNRRRDDIDSAKSAIKRSENEISSLQSNINSLSSQIQTLEQQRAELHTLRDKVRMAIPIIKTSIEFWQMFKELSKEGADRTTLLEKIVAKANERGDYHLECRGGLRTASTFFEAWKKIESVASEGVSNHMFSIDYTCVKCSTRCNALPHLNGTDSSFVCSSCYTKAISKSPIHRPE